MRRAAVSLANGVVFLLILAAGALLLLAAATCAFAWVEYFRLAPSDPDHPILWKLLVFTPLIIAGASGLMGAVFWMGNKIDHLSSPAAAK